MRPFAQQKAAYHRAIRGLSCRERPWPAWSSPAGALLVEVFPQRRGHQALADFVSGEQGEGLFFREQMHLYVLCAVEMLPSGALNAVARKQCVRLVIVLVLADTVISSRHVPPA